MNDLKLILMKRKAKAIAAKKCGEGKSAQLKPGKDGTKSTDYVCKKIDKKKSLSAKKAALKRRIKKEQIIKKALKARQKNAKIRNMIKVV